MAHWHQIVEKDVHTLLKNCTEADLDGIVNELWGNDWLYDGNLDHVSPLVFRAFVRKCLRKFSQ